VKYALIEFQIVINAQQAVPQLQSMALFATAARTILYLSQTQMDKEHPVVAALLNL
jgi:hypothetical protein